MVVEPRHPGVIAGGSPPAWYNDERRRGLEVTHMNLPIKFPSDADVIAEEAARFRALSPEDRMQSIRGMLAAGAHMMRLSPRAAFLREHTLQQEDRARQAVREFLSRHAE
jgi:hypothetical protein